MWTPLNQIAQNLKWNTEKKNWYYTTFNICAQINFILIKADAPLPEAEVPPPEDDYRRPVQLYRHWVR